MDNKSQKSIVDTEMIQNLMDRTEKVTSSFISINQKMLNLVNQIKSKPLDKDELQNVEK